MKKALLKDLESPLQELRAIRDQLEKSSDAEVPN